MSNRARLPRTANVNEPLSVRTRSQASVVEPVPELPSRIPRGKSRAKRSVPMVPPPEDSSSDSETQVFRFPPAPPVSPEARASQGSVPMVPPPTEPILIPDDEPYASYDNVYNLPDPEVPPRLIPYRSRQKEIQSLEYIQTHPEVEPYADWNSVPKWIARRQRPFEYRHVHAPNTWQADIIVLNKTQDPTPEEVAMVHRGGSPQAQRLLQQEMKFLQLFIAIECNSRYVYLRKILRKDGPTLDACLFDMRSKNLKVDTLITDAGGGFLNMQGQVKHIVLNMSSPDQRHSSLALIDRYVRTLRDMLYNVRPAPITERVCMVLTQIYNTTPHNTLSQTMGFLLTPDDVRKNPELELELIRRWSGFNYSKQTKLPLFELPVGLIVWLKYEPYRAITKKRNSVEDDPYRIIARIGSARYLLRNVRSGQEKEAVRSQIVAIFT